MGGPRSGSPIGLVVPGVIAAITMVWFSIGSYRDLLAFFSAMATRERYEHDDGVVRPEESTTEELESS